MATDAFVITASVPAGLARQLHKCLECERRGNRLLEKGGKRSRINNRACHHHNQACRLWRKWGHRVQWFQEDAFVTPKLTDIEEPNYDPA